MNSVHDVVETIEEGEKLVKIEKQASAVTNASKHYDAVIEEEKCSKRGVVRKKRGFGRKHKVGNK